jgi:hypothetical protein
MLSCLLELKKLVTGKYSDKEIRTAIDNAFDKSLHSELAAKIEYFNDPKNDKIISTANNSQQTMEVIHKNLEKLIERGQ